MPPNNQSPSPLWKMPPLSEAEADMDVVHTPASDLEIQLFDGDEDMFKQQVSNVKIYDEYGVGRSKKWLFQTTDAKIFGVDSDARWVLSLQQACHHSDPLNLRHCDIGHVRNWGWPVDYAARENYSTYTDAWWREGLKPDLVLIDGRFRVCSFLTSLKYAKPGTKIIFDDYFNRPEYHLVEEFLKPTDKCGRQALFISTADVAQHCATLDRAIDRFQFVKE